MAKDTKKTKGTKKEKSTDTQGRVEDVLKELGRKIDILIEDTKKATGSVRDEAEKKIEELKKRKTKLDEDFHRYKQQEKWQEAKSHFSTALHELKQAIESLFKKGD